MVLEIVNSCDDFECQGNLSSFELSLNSNSGAQERFWGVLFHVQLNYPKPQTWDRQFLFIPKGFKNPTTFLATLKIWVIVQSGLNFKNDSTF